MAKEYKSNIITLLKKYLPIMEENIKHVGDDEYIGKTLNDYPNEIAGLWNLLIQERVNSLFGEFDKLNTETKEKSKLTKK